jgi:hypothetical protein
VRKVEHGEISGHQREPLAVVVLEIEDIVERSIVIVAVQPGGKLVLLNPVAAIDIQPEGRGWAYCGVSGIPRLFRSRKK